jgi:hypothetical protein
VARRQWDRRDDLSTTLRPPADAECPVRWSQALDQSGQPEVTAFWLKRGETLLLADADPIVGDTNLYLLGTKVEGDRYM